MLSIGCVRNTQDAEISLRAQCDFWSQALESRKGQLDRKANWGNDAMISLLPRAGLRTGTGARSVCGGGGKEGRGRTDGDGKNPGCHATKAINAQVSLLPARSAWFRSVHLVGAFRGRTQQGAPCAVSPPPPSLACRQSVTPVNRNYPVRLFARKSTGGLVKSCRCSRDGS